MTDADAVAVGGGVIDVLADASAESVAVAVGGGVTVLVSDMVTASESDKDASAVGDAVGDVVGFSDHVAELTGRLFDAVVSFDSRDAVKPPGDAEVRLAESDFVGISDVERDWLASEERLTVTAVEIVRVSRAE